MSYKKLEDRFKKMDSLGHLMSVAHWDMEAMMPEGGASSRATALAGGSVLYHEMITTPEIPEWIEKAKTESLDGWQASNLREMERKWKYKSAVPADLVEAQSLARSECGHAWKSLRKENNWKDFLPLFEKVVKLSREEAQILGESLGMDPYDALINMFEPGQNQKKIGEVFQQLKAELPTIIDGAVAKTGDVQMPKGPFDQGKQKELGLFAMKSLGFDFNHGRLDISVHPFCGGTSGDVRITTRYYDENFTASLMGVIHETGHARYEQSLPSDWSTQPVGDARGMGVHEGQSLLFENMVGHSPEFLSFLAPKIKELFGDSDPSFDWSAEGLAKVFNKVERGYIRVDADEVTYPMHVILRFEMEQQIIDGSLQTKDIPEVWDAKMMEYLGLNTKGNYKNGCMQDMHWPEGLFGYFPSYTLGAMTGAQLFETASQENPNMVSDLAKGDTTVLNNWLRDKVWSQASLKSVDELMTAATGRTLSAESFLSHLRARYL